MSDPFRLPIRSALALAVIAHAVLLGVILAQPATPEPQATATAPIIALMIREQAVEQQAAPQPVVPPQPKPKPKPVVQPKPKPKPKPIPKLAKVGEKAPEAASAPEVTTSVTPDADANRNAQQTQASQTAVAPVLAPVTVAEPVLIQPRFDADYLSNPKPPYPRLSRRLSEEGVVVLRVLVNLKGGADKVLLLRSSGYPRLDETALETVKSWQFVPAKRGDQAEMAWVQVPIDFSLRK